MGNERLELTGGSRTSGINGFASRTDNGIQVLLYNFSEKDSLDDSTPLAVDLTVTGLPGSSVWLRHYRIDSSHSNAMTAWENIGQPATPGGNQITELESNSQLQFLTQPSQIKIKDGQTKISVSLPANAVSLIILGEESNPSFNPGAHIIQLLKHETAYQDAQRKLEEGDIISARVALEALIKECFPDEFSSSRTNPHCFWGQKALFMLAKLEEMSGNNNAADLIRQDLLKTTLNDTDRFLLLTARLNYLKSIGNTEDVNSVKEDLQTVRSRLEAFAEWIVWSDNISE
jgi:hypothetical protein